MHKLLLSKISLVLITTMILSSCIPFRGFGGVNVPEGEYWAPSTGFNEQEELCEEQSFTIEASSLGAGLSDNEIRASRWALENQCLIENGYLLKSDDRKVFYRREYICEYQKELPVCNTPFWQEFLSGKTRSDVKMERDLPLY